MKRPVSKAPTRSPTAFDDDQRDRFAVHSYSRAPSEVSSKRVLGRARFERLVDRHGIPRYRLRIARHEIGHRLSDDRPSVRESPYLPGCIAHAHSEAAHPANRIAAG